MRYVDPDGRADAYFLVCAPRKAPTGQYDWMINTLTKQANKINEKMGFSASLIMNATEDDCINAFSDSEVKLIVVFGHGATELAKGIETSTGEYFEPEDLSNVDISASLDTVMFASCYQKNNEKEWKESLREGTNLITWENEVTIMDIIFDSRLYNSIIKIFGESDD